jgi:hypothetical protein
VKKLVILAVGAILLLGVVAVVAVLTVGGRDDAVLQPAPVGPSAVAAPTPAPTPAPAAGPTGPQATGGYPPGPRQVQLPPGRVNQALSEPLAPCFLAYPPHSSLPAILTLELEAQSGGGFAVLDARVKAWGGATAQLVDCAQKTLRGQVVRAGTFTPGDLAVYDLALEPPPTIAPPPPPEPPSSTLPTNRLQPQRRGGSR